MDPTPTNPIKISKRITIPLLFIFLTGFSTIKYVKMLNPKANPIIKYMFENKDLLPQGYIIREYTIRGQCQRYKEQLILPINVNGFFERIFQFTNESFFALIRKQHPKVGKSAQNPGNKLSPLIRKGVIKIKASPIADKPLLSKLLLNLNCVYPRIPPIDICQNLHIGKQKASFELKQTHMIENKNEQMVKMVNIFMALFQQNLNMKIIRKGQMMQNCSSTPRDHKCSKGFFFTLASKQFCSWRRILILAQETSAELRVCRLKSIRFFYVNFSMNHKEKQRTIIKAGQIRFILLQQKLRRENFFLRVCLTTI